MAQPVAPVKAPSSPSSVALMETSSTAPNSTKMMTQKQQQQPLLTPSAKEEQLPWYRAGGMEVNLNGMALNTAVALFVLVRSSSLVSSSSSSMSNDSGSSSGGGGALALSLWLGVITVATLLTGRTIYCSLALPTFVVSFGLVAFLPISKAMIAGVIAVTFLLAVIKVNICMSVCLHRYAAHQAFTCGPVTQFAILVLGCLANQGGPVWWASQHRCHHKFCDLPRDPHSPTQVGTEQAFAFFEANKLVNEEFVPRHLQGSVVWRWLDTWAWTVVATELTLAYCLTGCTGLFCCYSSGWLSQAITLWFNVANHPPAPTSSVTAAAGDTAPAKMRDACTATDDRAPMVSTFYLPFYLLDLLSDSFLYIVMEGEHDHHHTHSTLAKRSATDTAYWSFVRPLECVGLVWNVIVLE